MRLAQLIFSLIILINFPNWGQNSAKHILKSYPNWTTNFSKTSIDLSELNSGGPGKDGIPAIIHPKFISIEDASDWINEKEPVIVVEINKKTRAYPLQILIWHEIVNDKIDETSILVTFCPLCYSAIVFNRSINGMTPTFGVSGLLRNSDLVMYDLFTESFWQQFTGEAIVGDLLGTKLEVLPSQILSFKQFRNTYPNGVVLSKNTGYRRRYGINPYRGYDDIDQTPIMYKGEKDERLPPNEKVIGVKLGKIGKAYPYSITSQKKVINDTISGKPVVIFHVDGARSALDSWLVSDSKEVGTTGVFNRIVDGTTLHFSYQSNQIVDNETSSVWDITGRCIKGKFKGSQLSKINYGDYFSFAWFAFYPNTHLYK